METGRTRRLEPGDEARLLKHADPYIHDLIIALLDTGCRKGELLNLRWKDVRLKDGIVVLRAESTKTNTARGVPISQRLKGILEMRRHGPDGEELGQDTFVFGNETGDRRKNTHRAWCARLREGEDRRPLTCTICGVSAGADCWRPEPVFTKCASGWATRTSAPLDDTWR